MEKQKIDFTNQDGPQIKQCPKCGRRGLERVYTNGMKNYLHEAIATSFALLIIDSCLIKPEE